MEGGANDRWDILDYIVDNRGGTKYGEDANLDSGETKAGFLGLRLDCFFIVFSIIEIEGLEADNIHNREGDL